MSSLLPRAVQTPRLLAFESAIDRIMQLSAVNIYDFDNVDASALYDLASQFNVLGYRGWVLAETEAQQRQLLKRAIELHRVAGTPYSIKLALESVGYPDVTIQENPGLRYDGSSRYDGVERYRGDVYGQFIVTLSSETPAPNKDQVRLILLLINEWKNLRSILFDLRQGGRSLLKNALFYDGRAAYDGEQSFDGQIEELNDNG